MNYLDLTNVLERCKDSANIGYDIASKQVKELDATLTKAGEQIEQAIDEFNNSPCYISDMASLLQSQLGDIRESFSDFSVAVKNDLKTAKKNLSKFSITLFGRTMAGKSTLMETLTNGDGKTIGKGAQRTTRDIRKYVWNDLEITDVPGIGAFEGQEDESLAFESAKSGDLILFLMTDDAPQPSEAECFGRIISLGKPVICVMNVRAAIDGKSHKMKLREINKAFNMERLETVRKQFLAFSSLLGQEWGYIPFVYVHLNSAFQAQSIIQDAESSDELYRASQIEYLKSKIVEQVKTHGEFYRVKTFIDLVSKPLIDTIDTLLGQSNLNSTQGRTVLSKKRDLEKWKGEFQENGIKQIKSYINNLKSDLNSEIASFAEDHFDDENADKSWEKLLKSQKVEEKSRGVLDKLSEQCNDKINAISREIQNELKFAYSVDADISLKMPKIIDGRRISEWTTTIVGGGLAVASGIAFLAGAAVAGPLDWIALGVTGVGLLISHLFKSRQKQEQEARKKLENSLKKSVDALCENLESTMLKNFDILIEKRIVSLVKELNKMNSVIFKLSDTQRELAWSLNRDLLQTNKQIVTEAIHIIGASGMEYHINSVARIPGVCILLCLNDGVRFPEKETEDLRRLAGEKIAFVFYDDDKKTLISRIIGKSVKREMIHIEGKIGVAHIPLDNMPPQVINKIKLAQQLSKILITK